MTTDTTLRPVPDLADIVSGAAEIETTEHGLLLHRLPAAARVQSTDPQLAMVEAQPAGVRLRFRTEATALELEVFRSRTAYRGLPARPDGRIDLVVNGDVVAGAATSAGRLATIDMTTGTSEVAEEGTCTVRFDGLGAATKDVEIWLPHVERLELVELRADAAVVAAPVSDRPVWIHHGSSISQGSNAERPTETWPVIAARETGAELINLGFGGSALLDPFVARAIGAVPADVISVAIGINLVNTDVMRLRAFGPAVHGFLDTIRDARPTTPLLVISPILCPIHEDTPGPGSFDLEALGRGVVRFRATGDPAEAAAGKLTLRTIRAELARIVEERRVSDPNLHYLDGLELYGEADAAEHPLPDALHPDGPTHRLIAERFTARTSESNGSEADWSIPRVSLLD
jgi:hypothetical protein